MSDYTLAVTWSGKDGLSDSDAGKVISGADFNSEFTTIQTAINSKADIASETLTGTPLAPTAAAGTNTTQIATTAFVKASSDALNAAAYPVGAIFTTTVAYANSAAVVTAIGGTTWAAFGAGKVLVGLDSSDSDFDAASETGGSKTASGTTGSHTLTTSEIPAHTHGGMTGGAEQANSAQNNSGARHGAGTATGSTGGGGGHTHTLANSIVQPYIVVYFWKRTA
tara:strand:+ start:737 stop:1408 length:672 start_codon:yes stop_codon:yes gene_type:complete